MNGQQNYSTGTMMLEDLSPAGRLYTCRVRSLLEELSATDQKILENALSDPRWTPWTLASQLSKKGLSIGHTQISKHKTNLCSCSKIGE